MNWQAGGAPAGWTNRELGEIASVVGGGTPKTSIAANFSEEIGHPWITPADLTNYEGKYIERGRRLLTDQGLETSSAKYMPAGTVLFSSRAPIGYVAIAANPVTTNQGFRSLVPTDVIDSEYLFYALRYLRPVAEELASGTTFAEISGSKLASIRIAFPPLHEQHALVAILDIAEESRRSTLARIATAQEHLTRASSAILGKAFRGEFDLVNQR